MCRPVLIEEWYYNHFPRKEYVFSAERIIFPLYKISLNDTSKNL